MTDKQPHPDNFADLHRRAEEKAQAVEAQTRETPSPVEAGRLLHELQVHQIELEMQNEELQRARAAAEEASEKYHNLFDFAPVGYFLWDAEGHILEVNLAGAALLGLDRNAVIQKRFGQFVAMENCPTFADFCKRVLTTDARQTCEVKLLKDGQPVYALVEGIAAQDHQGQGKLCRAAVIDITASKQAEQELVEGRQRLASIVGSAMDAIISVDAAQRIVLFNAAAEKMFRCRAAEAIGQPLDRFIPERFRAAHVGHLKAFREAGTTSRAMGQLTPLSALRADGEEFPMEASISQGEVCGQKVFTVILRDITERKQAEQVTADARLSAEQAMAVAEQANRAKDHFLAVLSHELRTPLMPVVLGASMLQRRPDLDPEVRETLEMIRRNVEMEAHLIDDLLDVTRVARGKIELNRGPIDLCTVIQSAVEVCKPDIEARGLEFGVDLGPGAPYWVEADMPRLQQVFWNLLRNAVKFTPHGGCVGIRCRPNEDHVSVEVNDSGIGIDPEWLSRVFDAFEQVERSSKQQFGGLGLGLAISKALVELHGGTISAHSAGKGKGATFRIRLPLTTPVSQPEAPPPAAPPQRAVRPLHILLVEDHGVTAKMMQWVLTEEGHTVETAGDLAAALELAGHQPFDLLVSDLGLPDGSGHDLMRQLRSRGHNFPGIALSGYGQEEDIRQSQQAGFAAHLTKPASREAIVDAVASAAGKELTTSR